MSIFKNKTIREQLTAIMMTVCLVAMISTSLALGVFLAISFGQATVDSLMVEADITAENCNYGLAFGVEDDVQGVLTSIHKNPSVVFVGVFQPDGQLFASYQRDQEKKHAPPHELKPDGWYLCNGFLTAFKRITLENEVIGTLCIQAELSSYYHLLGRTALCVLIVLVAAYALSYSLSRRLQHIISGPILELTDAAQSVSDNKDYTVRVSKQDHNELGILVDAFNGMLQQIEGRDEALVEKNTILAKEINEREEAQRRFEKAHQELLAASRRAGMAEVATDVLHNVGNILNSLNLTVESIHEKLKESKLGKLSEVCALLVENQDQLATYLSTDEKGRRIPGYIQKVIRILTEEQSLLIQKSEDLENNVKHIKDVVRTQQSYAKTAGLETETTLEQIINNAIQINSSSLERHGVELKKTITFTDTIAVDQQRLLQILVNLISNAKHATIAQDRSDKSVRLYAYKHEDGLVHIEVQDNGIGIAPENLTRIFQHGFTTRNDGHGFGLHGSALAAQELGGELTAHSDGPGQGATFIIKLPLERVESNNETDRGNSHSHSSH